MNKKVQWILGVTFILSSACKQQETSDTKQETDDRPTPATEKLVDVTDRVNLWVNSLLLKSRLEINPHENPWTPELKLNLIKNVGKKLASLRAGSGLGIHWKSINLEVSSVTEIEAIITENLAEKNNEIHYTKFADSRYGDNPIGIRSAKFMSHMSTKTADHSISPVIRIGKGLIGVDKLGHFAEEGFWYFLAEQDGLISSPKERWELGQFMEGDPDLDTALHGKYKKVFGTYCKTCVMLGGFGYYGTASTGVCSYGDLMANESGYEFFAKLYQQPESYLFDLRNFNTLLWNEEVSPNKYQQGLKIRN